MKEWEYEKCCVILQNNSQIKIYKHREKTMSHKVVRVFQTLRLYVLQLAHLTVCCVTGSDAAQLVVTKPT